MNRCRSRLALLLAIAVSTVACNSAPVHVRQPAVAGSFYPGAPAELKTMIAGFLEEAGTVEEEPGDLLALIAPHAGYEYSGGVAAHSYVHLQGRDIHTVIIIGPSHRVPLQGASVYAEGAFRTPLGDVRINEKLARSLIDEQAHVVFAPEPHAAEHSIETQIPFLQRVLPGEFSIVPIVVGAPSRESFDRLTDRIADLMAVDRGVFLVASTDLSHYHDYGTALEMDAKVIEPVRSIALEKLELLLKTGEGEMCGGWPLVYTLGIARRLGATEGVLYHYANSGDVTGDRQKVVGYAAMGLYRSPLSKEERAFLQETALSTVIEYVGTKEVPKITSDSPRLNSYHGVFVTINRGGRLRGCIGSVDAGRPLIEGTIWNAIAAATYDTRFHPMTAAELSGIEVEVSVLSPLKPLDSGDVGSIVIGRDGLYLKNAGRVGLFLPQVPVEQGWDLATYLGQLCHKAGITEESCWKDDGTRLYTFTAEVIPGRETEASDPPAAGGRH